MLAEGLVRRIAGMKRAAGVLGGGRGAGPTMTPPRPATLPPRFEMFPNGLTRHHAWMLWRWEWRAQREKRGEWTKPPYQPDGARASSTDPRTWRPLEDAMVAYEQSTGQWDGVGVALMGLSLDQIVGIDLDHVVNPQSGVIHQEALAIVRKINSYTERSPSGTGLRLFAAGAVLPLGWRSTKKFPVMIEMYDAARGRYLTVTGHHLDGTPRTIDTRTAEVLRLHQRVAAAIGTEAESAGVTRETLRSSHVTDDDVALLVRARAVSNGHKFSALWNGDTAGTGAYSCS